MLIVNDRLQIPLREFEFDFVRSRGPGGQRVNKVSTKAVLRWNVGASKSLPEAVRRRLMAANRRRISHEGHLVITSQRFRDQGRNVADCLAKLRDIVVRAAAVPKKRKPTRPTRASRERRLKHKREQSDRKHSRRQRDFRE
jgi:ribosome-associated protein